LFIVVQVNFKILFQLIEIVVFKPQIKKKKNPQKTKKEEEKKSWLIDICLTSSGKYFMHKIQKNIMKLYRNEGLMTNGSTTF
jgi:predicted membrane protein